ncbi:hypothetical protein C2S51_012533 [Perilla frutescens var. frutescens]|nr:hypothetical protein C2S51_012533 [Perilla frutescens var. frutescens]
MDSKLIKHKALKKPLLLKDYLLDDMSSCSSNGFRSFPRRQCFATTVRFLIEIDLNTIKQRPHKKYFIFNRNPSKSAISAFHTVIAAVKRLPFAGTGSPENIKLKKSILPQNLSMKILKKSIFWKRKSNHKQIQRWKSFDQLMIMKEDSHDTGNSYSQVNFSFTEVKRNDDDVEELKLKNGEVSGDSTSNSHGGATRCSTEAQQKQWAVSDEEKQQFSPVSVLDCPFQDDEELSSSFQHMEGITKKLMEKIQRFGNLDELEPLNLDKRFALLPDSDNESAGSPPPHSSASVAASSIVEEEEKALDLLQQLMYTLPPSYGFKVKAEKLLLDFFREKILLMHSQQRHSFHDDVVLEEAKIWINGRRIREPFLGWEVQRNRQAYMNDMEKYGEWKCLDPEIGELALELEVVVFDALFHELLADISSATTV